MEAADNGVATDRFRAMGSDIMTIVDGPSGLTDIARARMDELEQVWSRFLPHSDVAELNRSDDWVEVSPDTILLVSHAVEAWRTTAGAFDPTILPSLVSSGYAQSKSERAGTTELTEIPGRRPAPGLGSVEIDGPGSRIRLPNGVTFDPGGIGKGLAADIIAAELIAAGATAVMMSVGGDVRVAGDTPREWVVEVESPFDKDQTIAELQVHDGAVCTSSVRAKAWTHEGEAVHHIIDPASGHSVDSAIVSATVIAGEAWMAEALCKAAIISEPFSAIAFCEAHGVESIIVDTDGIIWRTRGIARFAA